MGIFNAFKRKYPTDKMNQLAENRANKLGGPTETQELEEGELTLEQADKVRNYGQTANNREDFMAQIVNADPEQARQIAEERQRALEEAENSHQK